MNESALAATPASAATHSLPQRTAAQRVLDQSKIIDAAVREGRTAVVGMFYNLRDGRAELVWSSQELAED